MLKYKRVDVTETNALEPLVKIHEIELRKKSQQRLESTFAHSCKDNLIFFESRMNLVIVTRNCLVKICVDVYV